MSTSSLTFEDRRPGTLARLGDYLELTKPKISVLVLVTVAVSAISASWGTPDWLVLLHTLVGTALTAASASALNQWLEIETDGLMPRTAQRPLPAGRLSSSEVIVFGAAAIVAGVTYLWLLVGWLAALMGFVTWLLYVWVYTPLKTITPLNTTIGAVAGAMPVLIGWVGAGGELDLRAATLFMLLYLWQFPHFMAIAWIYRHQYGAAGLRMLPVVEPTGHRAGVQAILMASVLVPVSLLPVWNWGAGIVYALIAALLGIGQLWCAVTFYLHRDERTARRLLRASLIYLPAILAAWMLIKPYWQFGS